MRFKIRDHLIIPFGVPKWDINRIQITGVSTEATYFESSSPIAYIPKMHPYPLCLFDYDKIWQETPRIMDNREAVLFIFRTLCSLCDGRSHYERRWLKLYFNYHLARNRQRNLNYSAQVWNADQGGNDAPFFLTRLPLPQAHLYLDDPLLDKHVFGYGSTTPPEYMAKVDFAFWTGKEIVAVEIDGSEPSGYERDIKRDRRLRRAGVDVIHILNNEIDTYGTEVVDRLLPYEIASTSGYVRTNKGRKQFVEPDDLLFYVPNFDEGDWIADGKWFDEAVADLID